MKLRLLLSLSLLWLALPRGFAQDAADFFHGGAVNYLSNNIPKALEVVTNGRALFPDDTKLKKLEELLKQQNQQQQQQQQKQIEEKNQQQKQDSQSEQQKQQQPNQSKPEDQQKQEQQQPKPSEQEEKPSSDEQKREAQAMAAGQMTPQQAKQLMDSVKNDERLLIFKPEQKARSRERPLKDW